MLNLDLLLAGTFSQVERFKPEKCHQKEFFPFKGLSQVYVTGKPLKHFLPQNDNFYLNLTSL